MPIVMSLFAKPYLPYGEPPEGVDVLWRCDARTYSTVIDADRELYGSTPPRIELRWFCVSKRTAKGAWISEFYPLGGDAPTDKWRFVPLWARNRFAGNTKAGAIDDFIGRRKRQRHVLMRQLGRCEYELEIAETAAKDART